MEGSKGGGQDGTRALCPTSQGGWAQRSVGSCPAPTAQYKEVGGTTSCYLFHPETFSLSSVQAHAATRQRVMAKHLVAFIINEGWMCTTASYSSSLHHALS